jgi:hypothetical protein
MQKSDERSIRLVSRTYSFDELKKIFLFLFFKEQHYLLIFIEFFIRHRFLIELYMILMQLLIDQQ